MLLIQNGLLYTMETEYPTRADILLKDGKIERIAPQIKREESMEVLDAAGYKVFPGFIDAHSH
ncbi:MAG: amidohydrolase, partial [Clostridia bacterium]|nr:amidohydrolase [Clostridia bacterium]